MEEADVLADRVAIMKKGGLQCVGSPLQLKTRFGGGFRLGVVLARKPTTAVGAAAEYESEKALATISRCLPEAKLLREGVASLEFTVAVSSAAKMAPLLSEVEGADIIDGTPRVDENCTESKGAEVGGGVGSRTWQDTGIMDVQVILLVLLCAAKLGSHSCITLLHRWG
jgi:hypothetical protein